MMWTYGITGNKELVKLAKEAYALGRFELFPELADADGCPHIHGASYCGEMKLPALLYMYTGEQEYKRVAEAFEDKLVRYNMLPSGVPSSAEHVLGNSIDNAHETCDISDFTWAEGYFLQMNGKGIHADNKSEEVVKDASADRPCPVRLHATAPHGVPSTCIKGQGRWIMVRQKS